MSTVAESARQRLEAILEAEIEEARAQMRPISRTTLAHMLHDQHFVSQHDAERFVDRYCDDKAPGVPTFLSNEFGTPYLKVVAVLNVVVAIALLVVGTRFLKPGAPTWLGMGLGTLFLFAGVFAWARSLRPVRTKARPNSADAPLGPVVMFTHDARESGPRRS